MSDQPDIIGQDILLETLVVSEHAIASEFGNGVSIMNLNTSAYYRLEGVAWFVWLKLAQGPLFEDRPIFEGLAADIQDACRVSADVSRRDVGSVLRDLLRAGLITVRGR